LTWLKPEQIEKVLKNGKLNLGTANGWRKETQEAFRALKKMEHDEETLLRLGRCYNGYTFCVTDGVDTVEVSYDVDSGD